MHSIFARDENPCIAADRQLIRDARLTELTALLLAAYAVGGEPTVVKRTTTPILSRIAKHNLTYADFVPTLVDAINSTKKYKRVAA